MCVVAHFWVPQKNEKNIKNTYQKNIFGRNKKRSEKRMLERP